jgi:catechol 2,3-dioxygenase-like lactoylglutathione lyase family enzyme
MTSNASRLRELLKSQNVPVSELRLKGKDFTAIDPDHHKIRFIDVSMSNRQSNSKYRPPIRMIHAGFVVKDRVAEDHFYKDLLGFHPYWHGGMKDDKDDWVAMQVSDGTDWVEYMLNISPQADKQTLGVMNHIALGVPDIQAAKAQLLKNGWKPGEEPKMGRDGKWQLNVYDPDDTRIEFMEFAPKEKPCCSEFTAPHPKP